MTTVLLALVPALALLLAAAPTGEVLDGLRRDRLYVAPASTVTPDTAVVREALSRTAVPTYVAVVAQEQVDAVELGIDGLMLALVAGLEDPRAVVLVVSDEGELQAGDGGESGVDAAGILDRVLTERIDQPFGPATLTGALVDVARLIGQSEPVRQEATTLRTVGLVALVAGIGLGGGGLLYARSQRRLRPGAPTSEQDPTGSWWH